MDYGDYYDNETDQDIKTLLNINRQTILNETKDVKTRINQLTEDQTKVFNHVETNIETQKLIFITGPGGIGKKLFTAYHCAILGTFR